MHISPADKTETGAVSLLATYYGMILVLLVDFVYLLVARYFLFITWFAPVAAFSLRRAACIMVCIYSHNVDRLWSRSRVSRGEGFI